MAGRPRGNPSKHKLAREAASMHVLEVPQLIARKWYFSKEEIEKHSPSRKDGIGLENESHLRMLYCSFLQELGMGLKVQQVTIATAMMLCHRFYMQQSHAKNDWQTIATVSMFLACKAEETPCWLNHFIVVSYTLMYKWDPSAAKRIRQKEFYDRQKELILFGERLLLVTFAFDLNIHHPYKSVVAALKRVEVPQKEKIIKVAWNLINNWLRTTVCLQYKPHCIAAGSVFLAAKFLKVKLPRVNGQVWWMQFDVSPRQLEGVIQQMLGLLEQNREEARLPLHGKVTESKTVNEKAMASSPQSCISNGSVVQNSSKIAPVNAKGFVNSAVYKCSQKQVSRDIQDSAREFSICQTSDCSSSNSIVEDGNGELITGESNQKLGHKAIPIESGYGNDRCKLHKRETKEEEMWWG